jgi:hypothetical protein
VGGEPFLKDMAKICSNLDKKHSYAITTNLKSDTIEEFADNVKPDNCIVITGSYHPHSGFSEKEMLNKLLFLRKAGFPICVNIVNHPSIESKEKIKAFFNEHSIKANISPYEECHDLYIKRKKQTLFCNGGLANYSINNNGDVYRCLTWFRFLTGYPKENIVDKKGYYSLAQKGCMGNIFDGSFNKYKKRVKCSIFCEWKNVVDPENTMVTDLDIRTSKEEWLNNLKSNINRGIKLVLRKKCNI